MSYRILCRLVCFTMMVCCFAVLSSPNVSEAAPGTLIDAADYDFGTVFQGADVTHDFTIKNTGDADLEIKNVHSG